MKYFRPVKANFHATDEILAAEQKKIVVTLPHSPYSLASPNPREECDEDPTGTLSRLGAAEGKEAPNESAERKRQAALALVKGRGVARYESLAAYGRGDSPVPDPRNPMDLDEGERAMLWILLTLATQDDEPKIDYLLKPGAGVTVVRFSPSEKAPDVETDGAPGAWLAVDPKEGLGIVVVKVDTKEVSLKSGERRSQPVALAAAKDVSWQPSLPDVEVTTVRDGGAHVRNRRREAVVVFTASVRAAVVVAPDGEADLPTQKDDEVVVVTSGGSGCRIPVPPPAATSPFEWLPDRTFTLRSLNALGHWRRWGDYDSDVRLIRSVGPDTFIVEAEEFDLNLWSGGLRADFGWLDLGFEYAKGSGTGTGRGTFQESGFSFPGTSDFDVEIQALTLFVERSLARFSGPGFRIDARGGLGLIFLREEISKAVIHTQLGNQQVDGTRIERERVGMARFSLEGRVEVTGSWSLVLDAGLEGHFGRGVVFGVGLGFGADF